MPKDKIELTTGLALTNATKREFLELKLAQLEPKKLYLIEYAEDDVISIGDETFNKFLIQAIERLGERMMVLFDRHAMADMTFKFLGVDPIFKLPVLELVEIKENT